MTEPTRPRLAQLVIGVDDSPESIYAVELAASIGAVHQAALAIVHVRPTLRGFGLGPAGSVEHARAEDELVTAITAQAGTWLGDYPGPWTVTVRSGNIARELLAAAEDVDADLVVLGHRSHGTLHDAILGSTAASTVHHSRRSVLVAVPPTD